jgi:predicted transcriptional regulator
VSEGPLSARALEDTKVLDVPVRDVMDAPFPVVDGAQPLAASNARTRNVMRILLSTLKGNALHRASRE